MRIDVVTIFPQMLESVFRGEGVVARAKEDGHIQFHFHNLRDYTTDKHQTVDDAPFGGGGGLIYKIEPLVRALREIRNDSLKNKALLLSPRGKTLTHSIAKELSSLEQLILFCGRYEGVDERFLDYIDGELSVGDVILSGGEIPAMMVMDAVARFVPGVVGQETAPHQDSFSDNMLEHAYYTRPRDFEGKTVPEVLLNGNHAVQEAWRLEQRLNITLQRRPDLLKKSE